MEIPIHKPMNLRCTLPLLFTTIALAHADDKQDFKPAFEIGKTYHQQMEMTQDMPIPNAGKMHMAIGMDMDMAVEAGAERGQTKVVISYEAMRMKADMAGKQTMNYDSKDPATAKAPGSESFAQMVGAKITLTLDAQNLPVKIEGLDKLNNNPAAAQFLNEDAMKNMFGQMGLMALPKQPVGKGESWEFSQAIPNPMMSLKVDGKYTYAADEVQEGTKIIKIVFDGKLAMAMNEDAIAKSAGDSAQTTKAREAMKKMGMEITDGVMHGSIDFDPVLHFARKSEISTSMTMRMKNPENGEAMEMPMKQSTVIKLLKVEPTK